MTIYGPPGTGKTTLTRRLCKEFADRTEEFAYEYVNLKDCRSIFSAANQILFALTGEKKGAYEGLDGVFEGIWTALEDYPDWTVLILDEIDHVRHDSNYDPNDFFYRLLRGEGKLKRGIQLSAWLISNELLQVDLRLDSRVESAMSGEEVFFPPYGIDELEAVLEPRLERAFRPGTLPFDVREYGIQEAARRWGDARKALRLFRRAGETANEGGLERLDRVCIDANLEATDREAITEKLLSLPLNHFMVLFGVVGWKTPAGDIEQPVAVSDVVEAVQNEALGEDVRLGERRVQELVTELETMGLVETWIESQGREGRAKQVQTTFDPKWVEDAVGAYFERSDQVAVEDLLVDGGDE